MPTPREDIARLEHAGPPDIIHVLHALPERLKIAEEIEGVEHVWQDAGASPPRMFSKRAGADRSPQVGFGQDARKSSGAASARVSRYAGRSEARSLQTPENSEFVESLMAHILEHVMIPKLQVERIVGPILGMFIPEIFSAVLQDDVRVICPEFPLRKVNVDGERSNQSTNIDWLLYARIQDKLVLVELKTTDTTYDPVQHDIYRRVIEGIERCGSSFLTSDVEDIMRHSQERGKYAEVLRRVRSDDHYRNCRKAKLVYVAPKNLPRPSLEATGGEAMWLGFEDLPEALDSKFPQEWKTIRKYLIQLDGLTRRLRNRNLKGTEGNSPSAFA